MITANWKFITTKICMKSLRFGTFQTPFPLTFFKLMLTLLFSWSNIKTSTILNILTNCIFLMLKTWTHLILKEHFFLLIRLKLLVILSIVHALSFTVLKINNFTSSNSLIKKYKLYLSHMMKTNNSHFWNKKILSSHIQ